VRATGQTSTIGLTLVSRHRHRVGFVGSLPFGNPFNSHHDQWGFYLRASVNSGNVFFNRSDHSVPVSGFNLTNIQVTSSGNDSDPRVNYDKTGPQRLYCTFARKTGSDYDTYASISTDDGATWGTPVIVIPDGKHPHPPISQDGTLLIAAFVVTGGGPDGTIQAKAQGVGDLALGSLFTFKDSTGTDIAVMDDTFGISQGPDGQHRWIMAVVVSGDSGVSEWYSTDWDARTWTRVV